MRAVSKKKKKEKKNASGPNDIESESAVLQDNTTYMWMNKQIKIIII